MSEEILIPKDSIEILNELEPGVVIATEKLQSSKTTMASVKINGNTYVEYEKTDSLAAQAVAERALKDLFFEQIKSTMFNDDFQYNTNSWKLLGSFAMFKLIEDWLRFYMSNNEYKNAFQVFTPPKTNKSSSNVLSQNQKAHDGTNNYCNISKKQGPQLKNDQKNTAQKKNPQSIINKNKATDVKSEKNTSLNLPADNVLTDDINPTSLLNQLVNSNCKFLDLTLNKDKPPFQFALILDNVQYKSDPVGSKKEAKKNVSKKILIQKFGYLNYKKE